MNKIIESLSDWGCNTKEALERMLNDEEFYIGCLNSVLEDPNFSELIKALTAKDAEKAFDCAHTLKGVLANLGLTPMYKKNIEIVEPLRAGQCENLLEKAEELVTMKDQLARILKQQE